MARNGTVAFTHGTPQSLPAIAVDRKGRTAQLTHLNEGALADKTLAAVHPLPVVSSFDKRPIDAWIVTPPDFDRTRKYPLILEIHGGPFAAYGPTFSTDYQLYAAAGYVVVYANPRGSTSYGEEFANLIDHNYPGDDYDDLMSVVDAAIAQGFVDENALFVTGGSGGGVLTAWIVGTHRPLQGCGRAEAGHQLGERGADHRRLHVHGQVLVRQHAVGRPAGLLEALAAVAGRAASRRRRWSSSATRTCARR